MKCYRKLAKWISNGVLLIVAIIIMAICLLNLINPHLPSIRCQGSDIIDSSISHPYAGETVPMSLLLLITFLAPLFQILITEILHCNSHFAYNDPIGEPTPFWKKGLLFGLKWYRDYIYGAIFLVLLTDICKTTLNSPRPHFLDSCRPNFTEIKCQSGWVNDYSCSNPKNLSRWKLIDSRKSFPSGHAALGMFSAIFMIIYQHQRLSIKRHGSIVLLWVHLAWAGWGLFCSLSRVADNRHHFIDITFGGFLGILAGLFTAIYISKWFRQNSKHPIWSKSPPPPSTCPGNLANGFISTVIEGYTSTNSSPPGSQRGLPLEIGANGNILPATNAPTSTKSRVILANTPQRPSLRRLLSSQSTATQMSDITEDRELDTM